MDHIVHPLKKSAQNLSHSIKTQAGDFTDGLKHVSKQAKVIHDIVVSVECSPGHSIRKEDVRFK